MQDIMRRWHDIKIIIAAKSRQGFVLYLLVMLKSMPVYSEDTALHFYRPLSDSATHHPITITEKKSGVCLQQSHYIKREDAWRCVAEGVIFDPCFVAPYGPHTQAVCAESPWSTQGIEIRVSHPLDNKTHQTLDMSRTFPWAMELSNGQKCQAFESEKQIDGLPVRYRCDKDRVLIGHVQRCNSEWKMLQHTEQGVEPVVIRQAWF